MHSPVLASVVARVLRSWLRERMDVMYSSVLSPFFLALPIIVVPFLYLAHDVTSPGHRLAFTELMKYGGLSCLPLGLAVLAAMVGAGKANGEARYLRAALFASMVLFAALTLVGLMEQGVPVFLAIIITMGLMVLLAILIEHMMLRHP